MILLNHPGQYLQDRHFSTDNIESLHNLLRFYITLILKHYSLSAVFDWSNELPLMFIVI